MKDNLNEEILRQLSLIKFDRSKTLLEQNSKELFLKRFKGEWTKEENFCNVSYPTFLKVNDGKTIDDETWFQIEQKIKYNTGNFDDFFKICWPLYQSLLTSKQQAFVIYKSWLEYYNRNRFVSTDTAINFIISFIKTMNSRVYLELLSIIRSKKPNWSKPKCIDKNLFEYEYIIDWIQLRFLHSKGVGEFSTLVDERQARLLGKVADILADKFQENPLNSIKRFKDCLPKGYDLYFAGPGTLPTMKGEDSYGYLHLPGTTKGMVEGFHFWSIWVGLGLSIFGGIPGLIAGGILDAIDGAIYLNYDNDPYMATVCFIFALVPLGSLKAQLRLAKISEHEAETFIKNMMDDVLVKGKKPTIRQQVFLNEILKSNKVLAKEAVSRLMGKILKQIIKKNGPKGIFRFFKYLHKLGFKMITGRAIMLNIFGAQFLFDSWVFATWDNPECRGSFQFSGMIESLMKLFKDEGPPENWSEQNLRRWFLNSWLVDFPQPFTMSQEQCDKIALYKMAMRIHYLESINKTDYTKNNTLTVLQDIKNKKTGASYMKKSFQTLVIQNLLENMKGNILDLSRPVGEKNKPLTVKLDSNKSKTLEYINLTNSKLVKKITVFEFPAKIIFNKNYSNQDTIEISYSKSSSIKILNIETKDGKSIKDTIFPGFVRKYNFLNYYEAKEDIQLTKSLFDDNMKEAIKIYQAKFNLKQTGEIDFETASKMYNQVNDDFIPNLKNLYDFPYLEQEITSYMENLVKKSSNVDVELPSWVNTTEPKQISERELDSIFQRDVNKYIIDGDINLDYFVIAVEDSLK